MVQNPGLFLWMKLEWYDDLSKWPPRSFWQCLKIRNEHVSIFYLRVAWWIQRLNNWRHHHNRHRSTTTTTTTTATTIAATRTRTRTFLFVVGGEKPREMLKCAILCMKSWQQRSSREHNSSYLWSWECLSYLFCRVPSYKVAWLNCMVPATQFQ